MLQSATPKKFCFEREKITIEDEVRRRYVEFRIELLTHARNVRPFVMQTAPLIYTLNVPLVFLVPIDTMPTSPSSCPWRCLGYLFKVIVKLVMQKAPDEHTRALAIADNLGRGDRCVPSSVMWLSIGFNTPLDCMNPTYTQAAVISTLP